MTIGPLMFFKRIHSGGVYTNGWVIAALHWKQSITWRWLLTWHPRGKHTRSGFYWWNKHNLHCGANIPILGDFSFCTQTNLWREDIKKQPDGYDRQSIAGEKVVGGNN